jgi:nucleoside-diphosphate-sugar epimerase
VIDLCLFQVYGPGDASTTVLPYVCEQLLQKQPAVLGSGSGVRDWIYIDDVIRGLVSAMATGEPGQLNTYDLGSGLLVSVREMAEHLASVLDRKDLLVFDPEKDRPDTGLNLRASRFIPGWKCRVSPEDGLKELVNYCKNGVYQ